MKNNNKKEETITLPIGKANKDLGSVYREKKSVPFHSITDSGLRIQRNDYAQLQALGQLNNEKK